jgi:uncharacterized membrane protein
MSFSKLLIHLRASLWFVPVLCVLAGALLAFGTIALDRFFDYEAVPKSIVGGPDAATAILATVAASMVSLAALVLTITMVVVQLAMGQFSPRIVQRVLRDKPSQVAIGLFVATFVYAILAVREVTNLGDGTGQVPGISVVAAFILVLVSIAALVIYVHHIGRSLRVASLIELVGKDTRKLIDSKYPDEGRALEPEPGSPAVVNAKESGVIIAIGFEQLDERAACWNSSPRWVSSSPRARRSFGCTGSRPAWKRIDCTRPWSWDWSRRSTRTLLTASGSSLTSRSARSPTRRSWTRPQPCRRSTGCTTS